MRSLLVILCLLPSTLWAATEFSPVFQGFAHPPVAYDGNLTPPIWHQISPRPMPRLSPGTQAASVAVLSEHLLPAPRRQQLALELARAQLDLMPRDRSRPPNNTLIFWGFLSLIGILALPASRPNRPHRRGT